MVVIGLILLSYGGDDWKLKIKANYLFSKSYGNSINDAIDFGTIDYATCPRRNCLLFQLRQISKRNIYFNLL